MGIHTIKQIIAYSLVFIFIFGLTSTFAAKDFIGQANEIVGLKGDDLIRMQVALNNGESSDEMEKEPSNEQKGEELNLDFLKDQRVTYRNGDTHDRIKDFQEILVELGYLNGTPDGMFGSMTENAVKEFQREEGLEETGTLNAETQIALEESLEALSQEDQEEENDEQEVQGEQGSQGEDIGSSNEGSGTGSIEHTVSANETLFHISKKYNVPIHRILQANNLSENSILNIGQKLIIPRE